MGAAAAALAAAPGKLRAVFAHTGHTGPARARPADPGPLPAGSHPHTRGHAERLFPHGSRTPADTPRGCSLTAPANTPRGCSLTAPAHPRTRRGVVPSRLPHTRGHAEGLFPHGSRTPADTPRGCSLTAPAHPRTRRGVVSSRLPHPGLPRTGPAAPTGSVPLSRARCFSQIYSGRFAAGADLSSSVRGNVCLASSMKVSRSSS
ncbi:myosin light chain kinase, smooth muscle-like [Oenanthe melanoleuca]|uniref:myosin light chain kinase, smooth muscle-like n=1 Tax=Oenanthe melanoleuca TaxID=2939378 RepID=UPI0024C1A00D|nr:myosin light chain kinase, smooth muscle-like [Oenanthe melanoleuca]